MTFECPLCNSFAAIELVCHICESIPLLDQGREADFYDDYSPYESIESVKQNDGYQDKAHECPHVLACPTCGVSEVYLIEEWMT
ncbi:hypothetical protein [Guptibacillus hwajinpoensis]|uniref:Uncharacterized protein n=1 Tax=Guptibacillus hwajinpoensis TaxID=208199 RepID=A0ABU0K885_9BACL|nr:hypothetical protein [Alkalihalobacillus hemicentroti]MDQ0484706.1 hypothetical protein [Alkalihalobacillus hemicentroti]